MHFLSVACLAALLGASSGAGNWDYGNHGPSRWAELFSKSCDGERQSPVNLDTVTSKQEPLIKNFVFNQELTGTQTQIKLTLKNDGHKLELSWSPELRVRMGIRANSLTHTAAQLHWHWGAVNSRGSEHTVDRRSYAAEGHLVFYNSQDYASLSEAANAPSGLAVLGVFYEISSQDNPLFSFLDKALSSSSLVNAPGKAEISVPASGFNIFNSFLPADTSKFYRYDGSLTTPPCSESVLWTVYKQTVPISERQLRLLRQLKFDGNSVPMADNYRPPLPLNPGKRAGTPRTVYRTF